MKAIAFNASPRREGNTSILIKEVFKVLESNGFETELIELAGERIFPCQACGKCKINKNERCIIESDRVNEFIQKVKASHVLLLGSPVYFGDVTSTMKAFIDRVGYVSRANGNIFKRKIGCAIVAVRRAGAIHTFNTINLFFNINEFIIPGAKYWNLGMGRMIGDVIDDSEGINTMKSLGENIVWLAKKIF